MQVQCAKVIKVKNKKWSKTSKCGGLGAIEYRVDILLVRSQVIAHGEAALRGTVADRDRHITKGEKLATGVVMILRMMIFTTL